MTNRYSVVMIREGTFRGQSPSVPLRFSRRVIAEGARTMVGKPVRIANPRGLHEENDRLVAGRVASVKFVNDSLTGVIELDPKAPAFSTAKALLDASLAIGAIQNVSIDGLYEAATSPDVHDISSIQFTALTLVPRGACSDLAGCGVSAALMGVSNMTNDTTTNTAPDVAATDVPTSNAAATGVVTFTVVNDAEPAKPCPCKGEAAQLAAVDAEKNALAAKLADAEAKVAQLGAQIADEKAKLPLLVELAALVPEIDGAALSLGELKATLNGAKLAAAKPVAALSAERKTLLAEPVPKQKSHLDLLRERMGVA